MSVVETKILGKRLHDLRYEDDCPDTYGYEISIQAAEERCNHIRQKHLAQSLRVTSRIAPDIWATAEDVRKKVAPGSELELYVYNSPEVQAVSYPRAGKKVFVIGITSGLVKLLSQKELRFVIGHELGHCIFEHGGYAEPTSDLYNVENLNLLALNRAAEISADRVGYIACGSLDVACKAILKMASGLSEEFLRFDVAAYLDQGRELQQMGGSEGELYSTHPVFTSRLKALLWFEMSDLCRSWSDKSGKAPLKGSESDSKVREELASTHGFRLTGMNEEALKRTLLWGAMCLFTVDNRLTKAEQAFLRQTFGDRDTDNIVGFVKTNGVEVVKQRFQERLRTVAAMSAKRRKVFYENLESFIPVAGGCDQSKEHLLQNVADTLKVFREAR